MNGHGENLAEWVSEWVSERGRHGWSQARLVWPMGITWHNRHEWVWPTLVITWCNRQAGSDQWPLPDVIGKLGLTNDHFVTIIRWARSEQWLLSDVISSQGRFCLIVSKPSKLFAKPQVVLFWWLQAIRKSNQPLEAWGEGQQKCLLSDNAFLKEQFWPLEA